jgi:hypothetical protein
MCLEKADATWDLLAAHPAIVPVFIHATAVDFSSSTLRRGRSFALPQGGLVTEVTLKLPRARVHSTDKF